MRKAILALVCCLAFSVNAHAHTASETKINPSGKTTISANIGSNNINVIVKAHTVDIGQAGESSPKEWDTNCTYSRFPCSLVDNVKIFVNKKEIFVPRSVFADLADLNSGDIKKSKKGMILAFTGGDASEAYFVEVTFNTQQVLMRKLSSAEFPNNVWEKTIYVNKPIVDK